MSEIKKDSELSPRRKNRTDGADMLLAAKMLDELLKRRELQKGDQASRKNREKYESSLIFVRHLLITLLPCLTFLQRPLWCKSDRYSRDCSSIIGTDTTIPLFNIWVFDDYVLCIIEVCVMSGLMFFKLRKGQFLKATKDRVVRETTLGILLILTITFDIIDLVWVIPIQLNMYLRALFFLIYTNAIRATGKLYLQIMYNIKEMLAVMIATIFVFALVAQVIFEGSDQQRDTFTSFWETSLQLVILQTTINYPDVMLSGYQQNRLAFFYFAAFIIIQYIVFVNMTISFFYFEYQKQLTDKRDHLMKQKTNKE